jgi:solute carrier family 24 (sodium/potassium/calcium exchanger), member 6
MNEKTKKKQMPSRTSSRTYEKTGKRIVKACLILSAFMMMCVGVGLYKYYSGGDDERHVLAARNVNVDVEAAHNYGKRDGPGCEPSAFKHEVDQCNDAKNCDTGGLINYMQWYYCGGIRWLKMVGFVFYLLVLFYMLGTTAEDYFCPTLSEISEILKLSPDVAGITILALGNGAPDIFSTFAAVTQGQFSIAIGELVGAGAFVTMVVVGAVALSANCNVNAFPFIRDVTGYLIGASAVCMIVLSGNIYLWEAVLFLIYYCGYVALSVIVNIYTMRRKRATQDVVDKQYSLLTPEEIDEIEQYYTTPESENASPSALTTSTSGTDSSTGSGGGIHVQRYTPKIDFFSIIQGGDDGGEASEATKAKKKKKSRNKAAALARHRSSPSIQVNNISLVEGDTDSGDSDNEGDEGDDEDAHIRVRLLSGGNEPRQKHRRRRSTAMLSPGGAADASSRRRRSTTMLFADELDEERERFNPAQIEQIKTYYKGVQADNIDFLSSSALVSPALSSSPSPSAALLQQQKSGGGAGLRRRASRMLRSRWLDCERVDCGKLVRAMPARFVRAIHWHEMNWYQRIFYVVTSPVTLVLNLTVPLVEEDTWSKLFIVLNPIFASLLIALVFGLYDNSVGALPVWALLLIIGACFSLGALIFAPRRLPERRNFFLFAAFLLSIMWIYIVANELVSLLETFGLIFHIEPSILGLTVLAWGNSIGDLIADIVVAKQGFPDMALAATFGGPLFNMLLGLGISMTVACAARFPDPYPVSMSPELGIGFSFLGIGLTSSLMCVTFAGFVIPRKYAYYLIFIYIVMSVLSVLSELGVIHF